MKYLMQKRARFFFDVLVDSIRSLHTFTQLPKLNARERGSSMNEDSSKSVVDEYNVIMSTYLSSLFNMKLVSACKFGNYCKIMLSYNTKTENKSFKTNSCQMRIEISKLVFGYNLSLTYLLEENSLEAFIISVDLSNQFYNQFNLNNETVEMKGFNKGDLYCKIGFWCLNVCLR